MQEIDLKNKKIVVRKIDNKQKYTLLLIHGYTASSDSFEPFYNNIKGFNLIGFNLPGNKYYKNPEDPSKDECLALINALCKKTKGKIIIVGHSLGGAIAASLKKYRKVKGYVFISALNPGVVNDQSYRSLFKINNRSKSSNIKKSLLSTISNIIPNGNIIQAFLNPPPGFFNLYHDVIINEDFLKVDLDSNYRSITKPILAIIGSEDPVINPTLFKNYFKNNLGVDVETIKGAKHNPMDNAKLIEQKIQDHIVNYKKSPKKIKNN